MIGPSWVLFTVMGVRDFPVRIRALNPQSAAVLGMSFLLGARGLGAIIGPLVSARWAADSEQRLRRGIFFGYLCVALGYGLLGLAPGVGLACLCVMIGHFGGSTVWVFSTTLLQINTDDRFRGRVFAADLGFSMLTIALGAYACGIFLDHGYSTRAIASSTGLLMLAPAALWLRSMWSARMNLDAAS